MISEAQFTDQVLQLAGLLRWRRIHLRPARTKASWVTAVQGDGVGFPDVLLLRESRLVVFELKLPGEEPAAAQEAWLAAFAAVGAETYVFYPADWPRIEEVLA